MDRWLWSADGSDVFSVSMVRVLIDKGTLVIGEEETRWSKLVPIKINVFMWRMILDKLPTRLNLMLRGLDVQSNLCVICGTHIESIDHVMLHCQVALEHFTFRDLWKECQEFGRVIDAFIPVRRSKSSNRFGFVRFIHIKDVDRLVRNLCTIWMGQLRLHANVARFQRTPLNKVQFDKGDKGAYKPYVGAANNSKVVGHNSYVGAVKNKMEYKQVIEEHSQPSLGFDNFILKYLGGFWVIIEFHTKEVLENFKSHVGVGSWFTSLEYASNTFVIDERVGELLFEEDKDNMSLNSKRLCIKTKMEQNIFETCKIIVKGKVFWIRAKEVSGWVPDFLEEKDGVDASDDDISDNEIVGEMNVDDIKDEDDNEGEVDEVPETIFDKANEVPKEGNDKEIKEGEINSEDPFKIYDLLKKKPCGNDKEMSKQKVNVHDNIIGENSNRGVSQSMDVDKESQCSGRFRRTTGPSTGGSILEVLDELIKVGQTMGYKMDGCASNIEEIIKIRGENESYQ
ncbi:nucleotide-binding alpha-beta plait domain-containing protein [Tanacetum coccineum]|uniref:Nucleotide-binding alpha-beta plait domain-containing protein n=1 Tax=Tanacetum coccineum TaxID=301880 RepID=A0ABQ4ZAE5_9ASTR